MKVVLKRREFEAHQIVKGQIKRLRQLTGRDEIGSEDIGMWLVKDGSWSKWTYYSNEEFREKYEIKPELLPS